jgi:hypothetical protein
MLMLLVCSGRTNFSWLERSIARYEASKGAFGSSIELILARLAALTVENRDQHGGTETTRELEFFSNDDLDASDI